MFSSDSLLLNKEIEICYLDNTYFHTIYSNIPTRDVATNQVVLLIQTKIKALKESHPEAKLIFKFILKNLGKETLLTKLADFFKTKIVCSKARYDRYVNVLELDKKYFSLKFEPNSFICVQDNDDTDENIEKIDGFNTISKKYFIMIDPSGLIPDQSRPNTMTELEDFYKKSAETYFRVPYSDHNSYNEIIEFIKKLKPKRVLPIVRQSLPNKVNTDDLTPLDRFLSRKPPINTKNIYRFLIETKAACSFKKTSPRVTRRSSIKQSEPQRKLSFRNASKNKGVIYESPEKEVSKEFCHVMKTRNGAKNNVKFDKESDLGENSISQSSDKENKGIQNRSLI